MPNPNLSTRNDKYMHQPFTNVNVGRSQNAILREGVSAEMNELRLTKTTHDAMQ